MGSVQVSGKSLIVKKLSAVVSPGTTVTMTAPIKTITLRPVGGNIWVKGINDADADAFPLNDGESLQMDLACSYSSDTATVCKIFTTSGTVDVYALAGH